MTTQTHPSELPSLPPGVILKTLENGLTVIIREDHSAPVVSAQAWCRAGSINEGNWLGAGLSHVLEHMLFKGTTTRPGSRIDQEVQEAGGYMNAYTSFDRTVYWINVPNTGGKVAVDILCDIMQHASLPADDLAKELDVIRREMDMGQDDPGRRSGRRLFETAFTRSPYRCTVIGYRDIFDRLQPEDIRGYYRARYAPNNLFFVVVGDIVASEVLAQIQAAFASSKAQPLPPEVLPAEPRQTAPREVIEEAAVELAHFHYAWHTPDVRHPDVPILDVLATLLGSGRSARLFQEIREKKGLTTSVDAWTYSPGQTGLFGMSATCEADKFEAARAAMLAELRRVQDEPVTAAELAKVVKQFVAGQLSSRKTMQGQAQDLGGNWMAADDLSFSERYLTAVKAVTPADVQRVARQYLTSENRSLYSLMPNGTAPKAVMVTETSASAAIQKFDFPNGLRLLVKEDHRLPFVEFRAVLRGGVLAETPAHSGLTQLLAKLLLKGTKTRNAEEIVTEIESVGGSIDTFGGNNSYGLSAEVMSSDFALALDLVTDVLRNPTFPADALELERTMQLAQIQAQNDHLLQCCGKLLRKTLFGDSGYGLDALGNEASVNRIQLADVARFHQELTVPGNLVLAIFGDVNTAEVKAAVEKAFGSWTTTPTPVAATSATPVLSVPQKVSEARDKKQAVLLLGFPGLGLASPDRPAMELLQEACSDLGSRLFMRIREKLGLAYYVGAQNFMGIGSGYFAFYCGTAPEKVAQVEQELLAEAALLRSEGLTEEELNRAKAKILGQKKIARQDLGGVASSAALDELYHLGFDFSEREDARLAAVTRAEVLAVAQKYLTPQGYAVAILTGPKGE